MDRGKKVVYVIGSLRNPKIPLIANRLREEGFEAVDDWISVGPEADDEWQKYEKLRGRAYIEALQGLHAEHVFNFDKYHLDRADAGLLVLPAGKSAHLELGYIIGKGKRGYILLPEEPERFDLMYRFAHGVFVDVEETVRAIKEEMI